MPILAPNSFEVISRSPEQTRRLGMRLGNMLGVGDVIGLEGDLGSGKTTLVQGIAAGWGSPDPTSSPTFMLVNVYRRMGQSLFFHVDAYRLSDPTDAISLDLDSMMDRGPMVIEWADRIRPALPDELLWIKLKWIDELHRDMLLVAHGKRNLFFLESLRKEIYGN